MRIINLCISLLFIVIGYFCDQTFFARIFSADNQIVDPLYLTYISLFRISCFVLSAAFFSIFIFSKRIILEWTRFQSRFKQWDELNLNRGDVFPKPPTSHHASILIFYLLWVVFIAYCFKWQKSLILHLTVENGLLETLTVLFYFCAAFIAVLQIRYFYKTRLYGTLMKMWLILFVIFFVFIAMEETNWGQTYFHYETPKVFSGANVQKELSFHNIPVPYTINDEGLQAKPYWAEYVIIIFAVSIGIIMPLMAYAFPLFSRFLWAVEFPLPSKTVQYGFIMTSLIPPDVWMVGYFLRDNIPSEVREVTFAACFVIYMWHIRYQNTDKLNGK